MQEKKRKILLRGVLPCNDIIMSVRPTTPEVDKLLFLK
jgi:hypothetical protein